jgi:hypothetical protein
MHRVMFAIGSILHGVGACAVIAACSTARTPPSAAPTGPPVQNSNLEAWSLTFRISGGFAGLDRELKLASSGELTATDRKRATPVVAQAPAGDLTRIASLVADAKSVDSVRPTACRDCLQFDVEIQTQGRSLVSQLNDMSLAGSGLEPLVRALTALLDRALAGLKPDNGLNADNPWDPLHGNASIGAPSDCPVARRRSRLDHVVRADQRTSDGRSGT